MPTIDDYLKDFAKEQELFHENMHNYPLFKEMIDKIYDIDIKEINDLLDKNDEYYFKKALSKLKDLNKYIQDTSTELDCLFKEYDKYAREWESMVLTHVPNDIINKLNDKVREANTLITSHSPKDIRDANKTMYNVIKDGKYYQNNFK